MKYEDITNGDLIEIDGLVGKAIAKNTHGLSYMDIAIRLKINYGSLMTLKSLRKKREEEHVAKK